MTEKQYEDMKTIMQFCRIFADQMWVCLKGTGLLDEKYGIEIAIGKNHKINGKTLEARVELCKRIMEVPDKEYLASRMYQMKTEGRGWFVCADPKGKTGDLPEEVQAYGFKENVSKGTGEDGSKPYPPDGLWVGSDYDTPYVDGGQ